MSEYITELANDIAKSCPDLVENGCGNDNCVACLAFKLIGLGYRKQEWISVEEKLPEQHKEVLVVCLGNVGTDFIATNGRWYDHDHWFVTHWMPLPEPPKMKGGAE